MNEEAVDEEAGPEPEEVELAEIVSVAVLEDVPETGSPESVMDEALYVLLEPKTGDETKSVVDDALFVILSVTVGPDGVVETTLEDGS